MIGGINGGNDRGGIYILYYSRWVVMDIDMVPVYE